LSTPSTQARSGRDLVSLQYHETTKHHFGRFARSRGYLDWATQPDPFRRYAGARLIPLPHQEPTASDRGVDRGAAAPLDRESIGWFLRYSMGLSAWKAYRDSRWALRVNPSSGNLHPTEAYLVHDGHILHYAPLEHAVEERAVLPDDAWTTFLGGGQGFLVALTSIHWREAWKYGERAFRYCQHDVGHAIAALRISASLFGWTLRLLPEWSDDQIAALLGVDRDEDRADAESEHPECIALVAPASWRTGEPATLVAASRRVVWHGLANVLSRGHDEWPVIERVTEATKYPGRPSTPNSQLPTSKSDLQESGVQRWDLPASTCRGVARATSSGEVSPKHARSSAREGGGVGSWELSRRVILQRRSALAFDARSPLPRDRFMAMLANLQPMATPFDAFDWPPHVHLALFVHRVDRLVPGVYAYLRDGAVLDEWRRMMRAQFLWEPVAEHLYLLLPIDVMWAANRLSCDQDIASDGYFSLGMIARLASALRERGEWFYRRLFWECGAIGQVLYLEAEAAGSRGTGIGCFYDDPVHELLGLAGDEWQSLYHFSMGMPVDDPRLTTEPGYFWEAAAK
jgi:SagB-type dehydrogenase family enzyme